MAMSALYARRFRKLRHAIVLLSKYTPHHNNAIHNGAGAHRRPAPAAIHRGAAR